LQITRRRSGPREADRSKALAGSEVAEQSFRLETKYRGKEDMRMISYQKPTVVALETASAAIQGMGKETPATPDGPPANRPSSGLAYDLDE
jgi:hypothetical protein